MKTYKYAWLWNEPFRNCDGQGSSCAKFIAKTLKNKKRDILLRTRPSSYVGHTLIMFFCNTIKDKKLIQEELFSYRYTDEKYEEFSWTDKQEEIKYALSI